MKQQGISDSQILASLKEEGVSPREINEALSQLKIKSAVSPQPESDMQPSIMATQMQETQQTPQPQEQYTQTYAQNTDQQYAPQDQYGGQYAQDPNYYAGQPTDLETIRDIARQETEEALKKVRADIENLTKTKTDLKFEVQNLDNRLAKMEAIIQELQTAIIRKMGQYGEAVSSISEELKATQQSFSKVINPLLDQQRNTSSQNQQTEQTQESRPEQKQKAPKKESQMTRNAQSGNFEEYFR
jgi:prefoldin subunit 5